MQAIKCFDFVDFFEQNWEKWKKDALLKAFTLAENRESAYAGGGGVQKVPIIWDADDYKFLCQFPPKLWMQALKWRYNAGLLAAAHARQQSNWQNEDGTFNYDAVPEKRTVTLNDVGRGGYQIAFPDVELGLRELMEKLEKPVKTSIKDRPPGIDPNSPGLQEIDPNETDPKHPKWRGNYRHGLIDTDLTEPQEIPPEIFDDMDPNDIKLPPDKERSKKNIALQRKRLKKAAQHSFAGMGVMQEDAAKMGLRKWLQAQALGLLGDVPDTVPDPITGEPIRKLPADKKPGEYAGQWANEIGNGEQLKLPGIRRDIKFHKRQKDGKWGPLEVEPVNMPYLKPAVILPQLIGEHALTPDQQRKLALRRGFDIAVECPTLATDHSWDEVLAKCPGLQAKVRFGGLEELFDNFDLLEPKQIDFLKKEQRDLLHLVAHQEKIHLNPHLKYNYPIGWTTNKGKMGIANSYMSDPKKVADKYWDALRTKADNDIQYFIDYVRRNKGVFKGPGGRLQPEVIEMLDKISGDLANVVASLLCLNLNSMKYGIYDPEVGLTRVQKDQGITDVTPHEEVSKQQKGYTPWSNVLHAEKEENPNRYNLLIKLDKQNSEERTYYVWNFVRNLSQAAFGGIPSRRHRKNMTNRSTSGNEEGEGGLDVSTEGGLKGQEYVGGSFPTMHNAFDPITQPNEAGEYHIPRMAWNLPQIGNDIDKYFKSYRNIIKKNLEEKYVQQVDDTENKMKQEVALIQKLYDDAVKQAIEAGREDYEEIGWKAVEEGLKTNKTPEEVKQILAKHTATDAMRGLRLPDKLREKQRSYMRDFINNIEEGEADATPIMVRIEGKDGSYFWGVDLSKQEFDGKSLKKGYDRDKAAFWGWWKNAWTDDPVGCEAEAPALLRAIGVPENEINKEIQNVFTKPVEKKKIEHEPFAAFKEPDLTPILPKNNLSLLSMLPLNWKGHIEDDAWVRQNQEKLQQFHKEVKKKGFNASPEEKAAFEDVNAALDSIKIPQTLLAILPKKIELENIDWVRQNADILRQYVKSAMKKGLKNLTPAENKAYFDIYEALSET